MRTSIQKWGNSYAVRIPKSFIKEVGLEHRTDIELTLEDGRLVIRPAPEAAPTLKELLADVTPENLHNSVDTGKPAGNEVW